jgi:hypothetical protein
LTGDAKKWEQRLPGSFQKRANQEVSGTSEQARRRVWRSTREDTLGTDYILRAVTLRRAGLIPIIIVSRARYWIATNPADPWGSREAITHESLRAMIDRADPANAPVPEIEKKPVAVELGKRRDWVYKLVK